MMILATVGFGIGSALEKATAPSAIGEMVLGVNPESIPLIAAALVGSLALTGTVWLYWRFPIVVWLAGAAMAAFAAVDVVEVVHQVSEQHPTLVVVAGVVTILHAGAAVVAIRVAITGPSSAPQSVA
jgi:hypothetical protein